MRRRRPGTGGRDNPVRAGLAKLAEALPSLIRELLGQPECFYPVLGVEEKMTVGPYLLAAAALLALPGLAVAAAAQTSDGLPRLGFSLAERGSGNRIDGPLLQRAKAAFAAAGQSDAAYAPFLAPNADAQLSISSESGTQQASFTAATIRAATESCIGPWAYDEGADWVQLSWICRVDNVGPLASILTFQRSPELSLTIWFEGGLIKRIQAMEPLWIPGARRLAMNAFEAAQANR